MSVLSVWSVALKELKTGLLMMTAMTVLAGFVYPGIVTVLSQTLFASKANGSLVTTNGHVVGSRLIAQGFSKPEYFHPRPSSAGAGYDATASAGSNLGPTSAKLFNGVVATDDKGKESVGFDGIKLRILHYCIDNDIPFESSAPIAAFEDAQGHLDDVKLIKAFSDATSPLGVMPKTRIPADAVTGSASGLDPDITPRNAELQAVRVAKARGVAAEQVRSLVAQHTEGRTFGFLGEPHLNVLELNLALDARFPRK